jgi:type I restriction enzyme S subunit
LSSDFTKFAISGSDRAGMPKVNRDHLFSYKINLPSISAQIKLTEQINQIKHEVKSSLLMLSKKLDELNLLKKSILRQAFNGELVKD